VFSACVTVGTTRRAELTEARITITNFTVSLLFVARRDGGLGNRGDFTAASQGPGTIGHCGCRSNLDKRGSSVGDRVIPSTKAVRRTAIRRTSGYWIRLDVPVDDGSDGNVERHVAERAEDIRHHLDGD